MPYAKLSDLPPAVREALPQAAQEIWRAAFNSAFEQYDGDEEHAAQTAWAAVKQKYEQDSEGQWRAKEAVSVQSQETRVQEWFPARAVEPLGEGDFRVEFATHGLSQDGARYYPEEVFEAAAAAGIYDGAKMYLNHSDPGADTRRGHRDLRDWGATIKRGTVQCVGGNLQAVAHAHLPEALAILSDPIAKTEVGLSQDAIIRYRPNRINGRTVQAVESITKCLSVDFVPEGNLRGRVLEAAPDQEVPDMALDDLTLEQLAEARPDLVTAIEERAQENAQKHEGDTTAADALAAAETRAAAAETRAREAEAKLAGLEQHAQIQQLVGEAEGLTEVSRQRVLESFAGRTVEADQLEAQVQEAVDAEKTYVAELLKASGVSTQVTGAGPTGGTAQAREAYEATYKAECERRGITYMPLAVSE